MIVRNGPISRTTWRGAPDDRDRAVTNRWLTGNYAPVSDERTELQLAVTGTIPAELEGRYLRNGPNPVDARPGVATTGSPASAWCTASGSATAGPSGTATATCGRATPSTSSGRRRSPTPTRWPPTAWCSRPTPTSSAWPAGTWAIVEAGGAPVELTYELDTVGPERLRRHAAATPSAPTRSATRAPATCTR